MQPTLVVIVIVDFGESVVLPPLLVFLAVVVIGREFHELDLPYAILINNPDRNDVVKHGVYFGNLPDARNGLLGVLGVVNDIETEGFVPAREGGVFLDVDEIVPQLDVFGSGSASVRQFLLPLGALAKHKTIMTSAFDLDDGERVNVRRGYRHTVAAGHGSAWR